MATGGPNQTATPNPIIDFTPQKNYLSFSGLINQYYTPATYTTAGAVTLLFSDVLGGFITHTAAGAETDTLPSAALLVPQIEGGQAGLPGITPAVPAAGSGIRFFVTAGGTGAITIAAGVGGTLVGSGAVAAGDVKEFLLIITATGANPTYTVYSLGAQAI